MTAPVLRPAFADRLPARQPTLAELLDRASDATEAFNAHRADDAEWRRLSDRAFVAQQAAINELTRLGLAEPLARAIRNGVLF